jgi:hypothetical protein
METAATPPLLNGRGPCQQPTRILAEVTVEREPCMGQCVNKFRLTQCLGGKALRPSSARGFMPQRYADKPSVVRYVINEGFDSILFADETWYRTRWPTITIVLH